MDTENSIHCASTPGIEFTRKITKWTREDGSTYYTQRLIVGSHTLLTYLSPEQLEAFEAAFGNPVCDEHTY